MNDDEFKTASQIIINKTNYLIDLMHRHNLKRPLILLNWNTLTVIHLLQTANILEVVSSLSNY